MVEVKSGRRLGLVGGGGLCTGKGKDSFRWENPMITLVFEED